MSALLTVRTYLPSRRERAVGELPAVCHGGPAAEKADRKEAGSEC